PSSRVFRQHSSPGCNVRMISSVVSFSICINLTLFSDSGGCRKLKGFCFKPLDSSYHSHRLLRWKNPMALRFYNTLTQQLEHFTPLSGNNVKMYTCGPTVYNYVHIGNLRAFTSQDILRRWLLHRGYTLDHVMNITDVEDKIIRSAAAAK